MTPVIIKEILYDQKTKKKLRLKTNAKNSIKFFGKEVSKPLKPQSIFLNIFMGLFLFLSEQQYCYIGALRNVITSQNDKNREKVPMRKSKKKMQNVVL